MVELKHFRILIVEDNKVNQLLVGNMLRHFGFTKFDCAENGKIALDKLRKNSYNLILMDIQMPGMNGYETTIEIRSNLPSPIRKIPIIALSANASQKEKEYAHEAGMDDYLVKPYTPEELYAAITFQIKAPQKPEGEISSLKAREFESSSLAGIGETLNKYTGGDAELEIQLIEIFLRQIPEAIQKFEASIPKAEWKQVYNIAHKLKGSIAIFEFNELKKIFILIEEYSRDKVNLKEIPVLFDQFIKLSRSTVRELETQLEKLKKSIKS